MARRTKWKNGETAWIAWLSPPQPRYGRLWDAVIKEVMVVSPQETMKSWVRVLQDRNVQGIKPESLFNTHEDAIEAVKRAIDQEIVALQKLKLEVDAPVAKDRAQKKEKR